MENLAKEMIEKGASVEEAIKFKGKRLEVRITIFAKKWVEYVRAWQGWADRLLKLLDDQYVYYTYEEASQRVNNILEEYHIPQSNNLDKLRAEVTKAAQPILDLLFMPNERPVIPQLSTCSNLDLGKFERWYNDCLKIVTNMSDRIEGAKNKLAFDEQKEQNDGVDEDISPITKKEEPDYLKYRYRGWDILSFLNEKAGHSSFYIQIRGGQKQKIEYAPFLLLLFLAIKLKQNKGGWIKIDDADEVKVTDSYNIENVEDLVYRLRERIGPHLRTVNKKDFIEVEGRKVRLSMHPSRVNVPHNDNKWLKNTFKEVKNSLLGKRKNKKVQRKLWKRKVG